MSDVAALEFEDDNGTHRYVMFRAIEQLQYNAVEKWVECHMFSGAVVRLLDPLATELYLGWRKYLKLK